jgi:hypothetical protein
MLLIILHMVPDADDPYGIVAQRGHRQAIAGGRGELPCPRPVYGL